MAKRKQAFAEWKFVVEYHLVKLCGMQSDEIPDWGYYDAFCEEVTPLQAAKSALEAAGMF